MYVHTGMHTYMHMHAVQGPERLAGGQHMCKYICMHACVYIYVCMCILALYIHTYLHIRAVQRPESFAGRQHMYKYLCMHACVCAYIYIYIYIYICMCILAYKHTCICAQFKGPKGSQGDSTCASTYAPIPATCQTPATYACICECL